MSRTFRYVPDYATRMQPWDRHWRQMMLLGFNQMLPSSFYHDPREEYTWGFDAHGQGYYHRSFPSRGLKEEYKGNSRRFYKRKVGKQRRQVGKRLCRRVE